MTVDEQKLGAVMSARFDVAASGNDSSGNCETALTQEMKNGASTSLDHVIARRVQSKRWSRRALGFSPGVYASVRRAPESQQTV